MRTPTRSRRRSRRQRREPLLCCASGVQGRLAMVRFLTAFVSILAVVGGAQAQDVKLRLIETTDIHTHVLNYDYYRDREDDTFGLARAATLIRQARGEVAN